MKAIALMHTNAQPGARTQPSRQRVLTACRHAFAKMLVVGAFAGLVGGVGSGLLGAILIAAGWFAASKDVQQWLSTAGSALLFLTIPLLILGGFCLDGLEKNRPQRRLRLVRNDDDE